MGGTLFFVVDANCKSKKYSNKLNPYDIIFVCVGIGGKRYEVK